MSLSANRLQMFLHSKQFRRVLLLMQQMLLLLLHCKMLQLLLWQRSRAIENYIECVICTLLRCIEGGVGCCACTCMLRATLDLLCSVPFDLIQQSVSLWAESNQWHALFCLSAGFAGVCCVLASCALHDLSRHYLQSLQVTRVWRNCVSISATEDHEACCESIIDVKSALCVTASGWAKTF